MRFGLRFGLGNLASSGVKISFGPSALLNLPIGSTTKHNITISAGKKPIIITGATLKPTFASFNPTLTFPINIAPGASVVIPIDLSPTAASVAFGKVSIILTGTNGGKPLSKTGSIPYVAVDSSSKYVIDGTTGQFVSNNGNLIVN